MTFFSEIGLLERFFRTSVPASEAGYPRLTSGLPTNGSQHRSKPFSRLGTATILRNRTVQYRRRLLGMNVAVKQTISGVSRVLIAGGGMSFLIGGRALHEFAGVERLLAEAEGLGAAVVLISLGAGLRAAAGL